MGVTECEREDPWSKFQDFKYFFIKQKWINKLATLDTLHEYEPENLKLIAETSITALKLGLKAWTNQEHLGIGNLEFCFNNRLYVRLEFKVDGMITSAIIYK